MLFVHTCRHKLGKEERRAGAAWPSTRARRSEAALPALQTAQQMTLFNLDWFQVRALDTLYGRAESWGPWKSTTSRAVGTHVPRWSHNSMPPCTQAGTHPPPRIQVPDVKEATCLPARYSPGGNLVTLPEVAEAGPGSPRAPLLATLASVSTT